MTLVDKSYSEEYCQNFIRGNGNGAHLLPLTHNNGISFDTPFKVALAMQAENC